MVFLVLAIISIIYWIVLLSVENSSIFVYIWLFFSIYLILMKQIFEQYIKNPKRIPVGIIVVNSVLMLLGILIFIITSTFILTAMRKNDNNNIDYIIVLGEGLKPDDSPNQNLIMRLDKSIEVYENNTYSNIIVCGGILKGRSKSEAEVMADYLVAKGISKENIILENMSLNTLENIKYSNNIIKNYNKQDSDASIKITYDSNIIFVEERPKKIAIVTSDYHMYRALNTAKKEFDEEIYAISAKSMKILLPHKFLRECFAILKYKFMGYL